MAWAIVIAERARYSGTFMAAIHGRQPACHPYKSFDFHIAKQNQGERAGVQVTEQLLEWAAFQRILSLFVRPRTRRLTYLAITPTK